MSFPLNPDPQYRPRTLANLTAATGAPPHYRDSVPNIDALNAEEVDASSLIPKVFGYLTGNYATEDVPPVPAVAGDTPADIDDDGYFGPGRPYPGGRMPPFPPPSGGGAPPSVSTNVNYGQPSIKGNAPPGSLIMVWSVGNSAATPTASVVAETAQSEVTVPAQNRPWDDEVFTHEINLPT